MIEIKRNEFLIFKIKYLLQYRYFGLKRKKNNDYDILTHFSHIPARHLNMFNLL